jgi:methionyl-tRNA formyltransferase
MGTPDFAVPSLTGLLEAGYPVVGVVTGPDKPRGRGQKLSPTPVKEVAVLHKLPVLQPSTVKDPAFAETVRALEPDIAVVVAFRILPRAVFSIPRLGTFNLHASLLPKYRGAAPIQWAIINGDTETGVTTFFLEDRVDTGEMLFQERIAIHPDDDAGSVHDRLAVLGAQLVLRTIEHIARGDVRPLPQQPSLATAAPKIFKEHCHIRWDVPAESIRNLVRGLSPAPGAWCLHERRVLKVYKSCVQPAGGSAAPGTVFVDEKGLSVKTADQSVLLLELQQEGRRRMTAKEFLRGYPIRTGDTLA